MLDRLSYISNSLTLAVGIVFGYTKANGEYSDREGVVLELRDTSKGKRVWVLDSEGYVKQYVPEGMSSLAYATSCAYCGTDEATWTTECCDLDVCEECIFEGQLQRHELPGLQHLDTTDPWVRHFFPGAKACPA